MKGLKLYIDYMSQPCRAVLALSLLKKIPIQLIEVRLNKKQHQTQHYKQINPLMKVPALQDQINHINMGQSHTIMRYLCRRSQQQKPQLYPVWDLKRVTKIDQYLDHHHIGVRSKLTPYIFNTVMSEIINHNSHDYNVQKGKKQVSQSLKQFQTVFLNDKFIVGDQLSIADISAYYEIHFLTLVNFNYTKFEKINKWKTQIQKNNQIKQANTVFLNLSNKIKEKIIPQKAKTFEII